MSSPYISAGATISADGRYRYRLWREWRLHPKPAKWRWLRNELGEIEVDGAGEPLGEPIACVFVMLNPSTADGETDDPTIRRCVNFAKAWGYDRLEVINLFAHRTTNPRELLALNHNDDPVGVDNQRHVKRVIRDIGPVVCAWGAHGGHLGQNETMLGWLGESLLFALKITAGGHPAHPLYLPADSKLQRFVP